MHFLVKKIFVRPSSAESSSLPAQGVIQNFQYPSDPKAIRLLGNKIAIEVVGAHPTVLIGAANEAMSISFVKFLFPKMSIRHSENRNVI